MTPFPNWEVSGPPPQHLPTLLGDVGFCGAPHRVLSIRSRCAASWSRNRRSRPAFYARPGRLLPAELFFGSEPIFFGRAIGTTPRFPVGICEPGDFPVLQRRHRCTGRNVDHLFRGLRHRLDLLAQEYTPTNECVATARQRNHRVARLLADRSDGERRAGLRQPGRSHSRAGGLCNFASERDLQ